MQTFYFDSHDYPENGSVFHRTAVRGIVQREGKLLLVTNKFGDFKFPGGGMEPGETPEQALSREMLEETGHLLKPGSLRECCLAKERRKGQTADILEMESYYYLCEIEDGEPMGLHLDEYEAEQEFHGVWLPLPEALEKNQKISEEKRNPWVLREIGVMEWLLKGR